MDNIVKQAMAKWPNVPHCYGWLALDARGNWRMRDERAQALKLPGDRINNAALLGFINRNYLCDERGRWYFQNGPQRVYVELEATPYIARIEPLNRFTLHTAEALTKIDAVWMTDEGQLVFKSDEKIAMLDDRDMAHCLPLLFLGTEPVNDDRLLAWMSHPSDNAELTLRIDDTAVPVQHIERRSLAHHFGFEAHPQADAGAHSG